MFKTNHMRSFSGLCAAFFVIGSGGAALAADNASAAAQADAGCSDPVLAFVAGPELHVSYDVSTTPIGRDRISLEPHAAPPEDAFVPFEEHPDWGRVAIAVIVTAPEDGAEYLPVSHTSSGAARLTVPALADYFAIFVEKSAPPGSAFADYLFHTTRGVSAGYHLVHAEAEYAWPSNEPTYVFTVVDIDQPIPNDFQLGAVPTGLNL